MSSPTNTVNSVMQWLSGLLKKWLPALPLSGVFSRWTALWETAVPGELPNPSSPLPWNIPVSPEWTMPIDGVRLIPAEIAVVVSETGGSPAASPSSPPAT